MSAVTIRILGFGQIFLTVGLSQWKTIGSYSQTLRAYWQGDFALTTGILYGRLINIIKLRRKSL